MEKMRFETKNITDENIQKILELFPNVATEAIGDNGELKTAIDFEKLKQELSEVVVDGEESYDFTWVGKKEAMVEANRPIRKTLRPDRESSVDWENTQNIYIEGDNLEALKLLQESYLGKVKMIYIDPPYNTGGNSFVYKDNFAQDLEEYEEDLGLRDEEGKILFCNRETNPRFHSNWCSSIYPSLKLAYNLLEENGIMLVSIDEHEIDNMYKLIEEFFKKNNLDILIWRKNGKQGNTKKILRFKNTHEYILVAFKNKKDTLIGKVKLLPNWKGVKTNVDNDPRGNWESGVISRDEENSNINSENYYSLTLPSGRIITREFYLSKEELNKLIAENRIYFPKNGDGVPRLKIFEKEEQLYYFDSIIDEMGTFTDAKEELKNLFDGKDLFDTPKPLKILKELSRAITNKNSIILDFFSGSATTAHAVMQLNAEDGGNRKFIMVQLPEKTDEKSEAYKAGYPNICEIGKERIRRAGKKIQEENPDKKIDVGFRVFKIDDTNMNDVYYTPSELHQTQLGLLESNIKSDRTDEDLLYGCLLDWGVELSLPHKVEIIDGKRVHIVDEDALVACFEDQVSESVMRKIAEMKPTRVVFKDGSFVGDANKINVEEIFKLISPETTVKVI